MDRSATIRLQQSLNLSLENVAHLKNPRLLISLDSDDQPNSLRHSVSSSSIHSLDYETKTSKQCNSCDSLKRMLYLRDRTIMKLAEDRDMIKIKLTKAMNMNIELSRQLMKYQKVRPIPVNSTSPLRSKSPVNNQIREEVADLRRKCTELDDIYHHLKHHLFALRNVFADLGANTTVTNDSGSGYHLDDDDSSSVNSSLSMPTHHVNGKMYKNKAHIAEDEFEDPGNESSDTDFRALPPTRASLTKKKTVMGNLDDNNNGGPTKGANPQQDKSPKSADKSNNNRKDAKSIGQFESVPIEEPQLSNFDIWYNS